jgi:hypothetical protein
VPPRGLLYEGRRIESLSPGGRSRRPLTHTEPTRLHAAPLEQGAKSRTRLPGSTSSTWWLTMLHRVLARLGRVLDLARLIDLRERHPDRLIAAPIVLHRRGEVIVVIMVWNHWKAAHP